MLRIHLLGALRLVNDQTPLPFVALPKVLPLLVYLLLHRDEAISRDCAGLYTVAGHHRSTGQGQFAPAPLRSAPRPA